MSHTRNPQGDRPDLNNLDTIREMKGKGMLSARFGTSEAIEVTYEFARKPDKSKAHSLEPGLVPLSGRVERLDGQPIPQSDYQLTLENGTTKIVAAFAGEWRMF